MPYSSPAENNGNAQFYFVVPGSSKGAEIRQSALSHPRSTSGKSNWKSEELRMETTVKKPVLENGSGKPGVLRGERHDRRRLYDWSSGVYKRLWDLKWHHSGEDTKVMKGRVELYD